MTDPARSGEKMLRGIPVSQGVCRGPIVVLRRKEDGASIERREIAESAVPAELRRLEEALLVTRRQIQAVQAQVNNAMGAEKAAIFEAHLLVLEDPALLDGVTSFIESRHLCAEFSFQQIAAQFAKSLAAIDDEYLRERATDVRDVAERVLNNLLGLSDESRIPVLAEPSIIIAHDLAPSVTAQLDKKKVLGFATDIGSRTSHTAIMARALGLPAVVGLKNASATLHTGEYVLLDGFSGSVIINPTDQVLFEYGQLARRQLHVEDTLREARHLPAITLDGTRVALSANIEQAGDADAVRHSGAEGVGLFRTEYLYLRSETLPTEDEQFEAYRSIAAALAPAPVIIRTLDLGGDKFLGHVDTPPEMNSFLGWRAIRFCLQQPEIFRAQLRAILRASAAGNVKMMYPMISGVAELEQANAFLDQCKAELRAEGRPFNEHLEVGVMIEIPSAALAADALARRVKFFSIGTNDLIQYTLAVDRLNEKIAHLYEPTHPAVLRLIEMTVAAARRHGIPTGVCGEMAGDPALAPLLLGLGVDELSASPSAVPAVKFLLRRLKMADARALAADALASDCPADILTRTQALARQCAPELFENQSV
jgi:phosphotransferase system enzyme I (PtsI)